MSILFASRATGRRSKDGATIIRNLYQVATSILSDGNIYAEQ
jgi:hypothetical protein